MKPLRSLDWTILKIIWLTLLVEEKPGSVLYAVAEKNQRVCGLYAEAAFHLEVAQMGLRPWI